MSSGPAYFKLAPAEQRAKFLKISQACDEHLDDAYGEVLDSEWSVSEALKKNNALRNRYSNVFPWDKTRVQLPVLPGAQSDYINASKISLGKGFDYIAAQGPLVNTIPHFWAMAFHQAELQKTDTIVVAMMTPLVEAGREKCSRYWPKEKNEMWDFTEVLRTDGISPGELKITLKSTERIHNGDLIFSQFTLDSPTTSKTVLHYYFQKWEDAKVPESMDPILALSLEIRKVTEKDPQIAPIVHCSAGVGRTGTYIAIDYLLNGPTFFASDIEDPVYDVVTRLRSQRMMMVQTVYQFMFLYGVAKRLYEEKIKSG
ncbi:hypothetical protein FT663_01492 [Candidozyma haemuli var. vulneris]|uniref:Uncharacterized protein n=1 Tax=Candidozyma haemuli TaxID=45357 RepID=A0A2V1ATI9_9ASCO|nr:hypothetical protein CXQ85_000113 [[Candida] haemuloni]KAF3990120.1 hypothetical protein FT662_02444 [[Candida] haemuloni var. vulneris]KAF3994372.1 hypothetical protein FT663_01492 [[Candida] haemuloni var. vulneris]PVH21148.1 hypothetical protein CXQ85_000113 [[Candida] haemuloni]